MDWSFKMDSSTSFVSWTKLNAGFWRQPICYFCGRNAAYRTSDLIMSDQVLIQIKSWLIGWFGSKYSNIIDKPDSASQLDWHCRCMILFYRNLSILLHYSESITLKIFFYKLTIDLIHPKMVKWSRAEAAPIELGRPYFCRNLKGYNYVAISYFHCGR